MLKAMRKHAKYFYVLFFVVILSFMFWGVGSVDKSTNVPVAEVEKEKISLEEYWMAYDRLREFYKNTLKEKFTEETEKQLNLKQRVLNSLIDERVLVVAAKNAGITVNDDEIKEAIVTEPVFMRDGKFNEDVYIRTLQLNRMTPQFFESMKKRELVVQKMRRLIGESVDTTQVDTGGDIASPVKQAMLFEMREGGIKSYIEGLKKSMRIKINQQLFS